jgi:precorrin-3B methylase
MFRNPRSRTRADLLLEAMAILLGYRGPEAPVGIVSRAFRPDSSVRLCTLGSLPGCADRVDMSSVVIVGASDTRRIGDLLVTPRGYPCEGGES